MDVSPYSPPNARLTAQNDRASLFYVVSARKFWVLMVATFGHYSLYWFYRHWKAYKAHRRSDEWPVLRAIFAIFFTHDLFRTFAKERNANGVRSASSMDDWATGFVVTTLIKGVLFQMVRVEDAHPVILIMDVIVFLFVAWPLALSQRVANAACDDPDGLTNSRLSWANWIWIVLGVAGWSLVALGFWVVFGGQLIAF